MPYRNRYKFRFFFSVSRHKGGFNYPPFFFVLLDFLIRKNYLLLKLKEMKNHYELAKEKFEAHLNFSLEKKKTITLPLFVWRALENELMSCMDVSSCRITDCLQDLENDNLEIRENAKWLLQHEIELQYSYNLLKRKLNVL